MGFSPSDWELFENEPRMRRYVFMVLMGQVLSIWRDFLPPSLTSSRCENPNVIFGELFYLFSVSWRVLKIVDSNFARGDQGE